MTRTIPSQEPKELFAVATWEWDKHLPDFLPSAGWTLEYALQGRDVVATPIQASPSTKGDYFEIRDTPAGHPNLRSGGYTLIGTVTDGTNPFIVYSEPLRIVAFETGVSFEGTDEQQLRLVDEVLLGRIPKDMAEFAVNGRTVRHESMEWIAKQQGILRARITNARSGGKIRTVKPSFRSPHA